MQSTRSDTRHGVTRDAASPHGVAPHDVKHPDVNHPDVKHHEVVVIGGGLVGASLAIALDRLGVDVGLVEATPANALPAVFDERNLSLAEATTNALNALGVLQELRTPTGAIRRIHVSRNGDFGRVKLDAADYGRVAFGQVVVARDFGEALETCLSGLRKLTRYRPARFVGFADGGDSMQINGARRVRIADADGERILSARLVVAADGTRSGVRDALGIGADEHDYQQTLFVARVRAERMPDGMAYERFGDDGPTALLPRGDRHYGVVHGVARDVADVVAALDDAAWLARLQQAFGWRVGRFLASGPRSAYPVTRVVAQCTTGARVVLVGNAAQTLHPIGAQGFNLGLRDALTLAELIEADLIDGGSSDPGAPALLDAYVQRRREDRERTLAFSDGLAKLTSSPASLLRPLRSLGLLLLDRLPATQALLVGGALGYRGDVPRLCRSDAA